LPNRNKKPLFSATVIRIVLWDIAIFFLLFVTSNVFTIVITNKILTDNLDERLKNKIETLLDDFKVQNDSVIFNGYSEISEPDFMTINSGAIFLQVKNTEDRILLISKNVNNFGIIPFNVPENILENGFYSITYGQHQLRVVYTPLFNQQKRIVAYIQLAVFRTAYSSIMNKIVIFNLFNLPFTLLIIILVSIFLAKKKLLSIK
jgi:hypothetical protein